MKTYQVVFDEEKQKGLYALSVVENPAMEDYYITLSVQEQELQFSVMDEEKRLLLGAALIPDKKILRTDPESGEQFYIVFNRETIEKAAHAFIRNGFQGNSTREHQVKLDGVSVVEAWTVEDSEKDKSAAHGKNYPPGTFVTMMKVYNDKVWEDSKNGTLNGFSIDGLFGLKEINLNKTEMEKDKKQSIQDELKVFFAGILKKEAKEEVKLGQLKLKDGETVLEFEGDKPEVGMPVFILSMDEDKGEKIRIAAPEGEHELESGEKLFIDKNGLVAEEAKEEVKADPKEEDVVAELKAFFSKEIKEMKEDFEAKLQVEKDKNAELEKKLEEEPAAEKIVRTELAIEEPKTREDRLLNAAAMVINKN